MIMENKMKINTLLSLFFCLCGFISQKLWAIPKHRGSFVSDTSVQSLKRQLFSERNQRENEKMMQMTHFDKINIYADYYLQPYLPTLAKCHHFFIIDCMKTAFSGEGGIYVYIEEQNKIYVTHFSIVYTAGGIEKQLIYDTLSYKEIFCQLIADHKAESIRITQVNRLGADKWSISTSFFPYLLYFLAKEDNLGMLDNEEYHLRTQIVSALISQLDSLNATWKESYQKLLMASAMIWSTAPSWHQVDYLNAEKPPHLADLDSFQMVLSAKSSAYHGKAWLYIPQNAAIYQYVYSIDQGENCDKALSCTWACKPLHSSCALLYSEVCKLSCNIVNSEANERQILINAYKKIGLKWEINIAFIPLLGKDFGFLCGH